MHMTDLNSIRGSFGRLSGELRPDPKLGTGRYGSLMCITRQRARETKARPALLE
jgi:hypothetical protein